MRFVGQLSRARLRQAIDANPINVAEGYVFTEAVIGTVSTDAGGSAWVALPGGSCRAVNLSNPNNTIIEYRRNGSGQSFSFPAFATTLIIGITNSNQIEVRRLDQVAAAVNLSFERLS